MKRIAVFSGKRGGFGAMLRIMKGIDAHPELELKVIVSDMHLNPVFGHTADEVRSLVPIDAQIDLGEYGDSPLDRTMALGRLVESLAPALEKLRPDILLLLGDRGETLAAAMCAVEMGIVVAHIQAGDISGGLDDIHRHATTKLAHLHFSQNERQRERVIRLGEDPARVWASGAPYVDNIIQGGFPSSREALASLGLDFAEPYFIMIHHSDTYRTAESYDQAKAILTALTQRSERAIVLYPCSDPGFKGIFKALDEFKNHERFRFFPNIDFRTFLGLLSGARALVGNSSCGILEAPYFRLPFINVGQRQKNRETSTNVIHAEPNVDAILDALAMADGENFRKSLRKDDHPFGDGNACERIVDVLASTEITPELFCKRITF